MNMSAGEQRCLPSWPASVALLLFAWSLPVSLFGMQAGVVAMLAVCLWWRGRCLRRSPLDLAVISLLAAELLSLLCAPAAPTSLVSATSFWVMSAFSLSYWLLRRDGQLRLALGGLIILACLAALLGVWQAITASYPGTELMHPGMNPRLRLVPISNRPAAVGFFFSRLTFAHVLLFPFCWSAALALGPGPARWRLPAAMATVVLGAGLFATFTRAAPVAGAVAVAGLVVTRMRRKSRRWWAMLLLGLVALSAILAVPALRQRLLRSFSGQRDWTRLTIWHTALDLASAHPLTGIGYGNFQRLARRPIERRSLKSGWKHFGGVVAWAHNNLFTFLAETGLLGTWAFCLLFVVYFRKLLSFVGKSQAPPGLPGAVIEGSPAAVASFLFVGLFHDNFFDGEVVFTLWFTLAASLAAVALFKQRPAPVPVASGENDIEIAGEIPEKVDSSAGDSPSPNAGDSPGRLFQISVVISECCWWLLVFGMILGGQRLSAKVALVMAGAGLAGLCSRRLARLLPLGLLLGVANSWQGERWQLLALLALALLLAGTGRVFDKVTMTNKALEPRTSFWVNMSDIRLALILTIIATWGLALVANLLLAFRSSVAIEPGSLVLLPMSAVAAGVWIGLDGLVRRCPIATGAKILGLLRTRRLRLGASLLLVAGLQLVL